jgi:hypothetical protein
VHLLLQDRAQAYPETFPQASLRDFTPFPDADSVNNIHLSFVVQRFFNPDWKPGHPACSAYGKICSHFSPSNMILGRQLPIVLVGVT